MGGTVSFVDGTTTLFSEGLSAAGTATYSTTGLAVGPYVITAVYSGDANYGPSQSGTITGSTIDTRAGGGVGDGELATTATLNHPYALAVDSSGDMFIADTLDNRIREVNGTTGVITTVAGTGVAGYSGDSGPATSAELNAPMGIALNSSGQLLFIADSGNATVREVNLATGVISTVAGNGTGGYSGDGGLATSARLSDPTGLTLDSSGNLFIADTGNNVIREVHAATHTISTFAGNGQRGSSGNGGLATSAKLAAPSAVALDSSGDLFIADTMNNEVREVIAGTGVINLYAGTGVAGDSGDGGAATAAELEQPIGLAVNSVSGLLFITDSQNNEIRQVNLGSGVITPVAGDGFIGYLGDGGAATAAELDNPEGVAVDSSGNIFIADTYNAVVREVSVATGDITTIAGNGLASFYGDGGPATLAALHAATDVAVDSLGDLFIVDSLNNRIREVSAATGLITTVAGTGVPGSSGDGGQATAAELNFPTAVALDSSGQHFHR